MNSINLQSGVSRLFCGRDISGRAVEVKRIDGFTVATSSFLTMSNMLANFSAILITARPWMGKTFVAKKLYDHLCKVRDEPDQPEAFGEYIDKTLFEQYCPGETFFPEWWESWKKSTNRACWIIDALDEGHYLHQNICDQIIKVISELEESARERLMLVMFSREAELPPDVKERLASLYKSQFLYAELLPLDRQNAESIVGSDERFSHTVEIIRRCSLQEVAGIPAVLDFLSGQSQDAELNDVEVWRGVLNELLKERNERKYGRFTTELECRFRAAAHIAIACTFADITEIRSRNMTNATPTIEDIIPVNPSPGYPNRQSAREAVQTMLFTRTSNGFRFAQRNIQEWMCAFGMAELPLEKCKPLITDEKGILNLQFREVISLFYKVTGQNKTHDWLIKQSGGVLAGSDSSVWGLSEVIRVLDRIEEIVAQSPWRLSLFNKEQFELLGVPGIGLELKKRIKIKTKTSFVRSFLFDIASHLKAEEVIPVAINILKDEKEDEKLRRTAVAVVSSMGTDGQIKSLSSFVKNANSQSRVEKDSVSTIIIQLLNRKVWNLLQAIEYIPEVDDEIIDHTNVLYSHIKQNMTLEDSRRIVQRDIHLLLEQKIKNKGRRNLDRKKKISISLHALENLLKWDSPSDGDVRILIPLLDALASEAEFSSLSFDLSRSVGASMKFRRALYERSFIKKPGRENGNWIVRNILNIEDLRWLQDQTLYFAKIDESVWEDLLRLAYSPAAQHKDKLRIRKFVTSHKPKLIGEFDRNRRMYMSRHRREQEKYKGNKKPQFEISEIVEKILENKKISLKKRMWDLSWICFSDQYSRPENVNGQWEDLSENLKKKVLDLCTRAVQECNPTKIPDGRSFPTSVLHEASCFKSVLLTQPVRLNLSSRLIRRWLPAVLLLTFDDQNDVIDICSEADRLSTEAIILESIKREMRSGSEHMSIASNLDAKYWTKNLAKSIANMVRSKTYNQKLRVELLRILTQRYAEYAKPIIESVLRDQKGQDEEVIELWKAGLDCLLVLDVDKAFPILKKDYEKRGFQALVDAGSLYERNWRLNAQVLDWSSDKLLNLARMLYESLPPDSDFPSSGIVTPQMELYELREKIVRRLIDIDDGAIKVLSEEQPVVRKMYKYNHTISSVGKLLKPEPLPLEKVVRLLENANYRIIRNNNDLLDVLNDELNRMREDLGEHLILLYEHDKDGDGTKRKNEKALQVYIKCRLSDRLPGKILDKETEVSFGRRMDIRVISPTVYNDNAIVVIEVKWSDNKEMSVGLSDQLGAKYLTRENLTHGIYLVGWNGRLVWQTSRAGKRPNPQKCPQELHYRLEEQAHNYMDEREAVKIYSIVLDLQLNRN